MIRFALRCEHDHEFEGWFRDGATCETQLADGAVSCPWCGSQAVSKALMTPSVVTTRSRERNQPPPDSEAERKDTASGSAMGAGAGAGGRAVGGHDGPATPPAAGDGPATGPGAALGPTRGPDPSAAYAALREAVETLRQQVEATCEDVGPRFAEEARMMHYGEAEVRPIYGEASLQDARDLTEEGIAVAPLPWIRRVRN